MKHAILLLLCLLALLALVGCGDVKNAAVEPWAPSKLHSDGSINAAMRQTKRIFARRFDGCALTELAYAGDDGETITILASFDVDSTGGPDGVLNPNTHYTRYKFTFSRGLFGLWKLAENGYA